MHEVQNSVDNERKARKAEYYKARYQAEPEKYKSLAKAWRQANPLKVKASNDAWRQAHREGIKVSNKAWYQANPKKSSAFKAKRRARKRGAPGTANYVDRQARKEMYGNRCWECGKPAAALDHVKPLVGGSVNDRAYA